MEKNSGIFAGCLATLFFALLFLLLYLVTADKKGIIFRNFNKLFLVLTTIPTIFLILVAIYLLITVMVKTTMFLL